MLVKWTSKTQLPLNQSPQSQLDEGGHPVEGEGGLLPVAVAGEGEDAADEGVGDDAHAHEGGNHQPVDDLCGNEKEAKLHSTG